jgi:hypothetical protein
MTKSSSVLLVAALMLVEPASHAHHSASIYDREARVSIEGVVVRREWRNPHVYLYVEQEASGERVVWEIEGLAPFVLRERAALPRVAPEKARCCERRFRSGSFAR